MARKSRRLDPAAPSAPSATAAEPQRPPLESLAWTTREWKIAAILVALAIAVFGQLASHTFLNYDDGQFLYENDAVKQGLTGSSIAWALTSASIGWYPATWISHMADVSLFGLRANAHLLIGLLLHIASTIILFAALHRLTRAPIRSAFVAALFAIHPMHVESVAWASERKDTLSTLFAMLSLLFYARAAKGRQLRDQVLTAVAMLLSLMAKQMLVTLPFVFLLLDYWPLERLDAELRDVKEKAREKWPLFVLTIVGCIAAVVGQRNLQAVTSAEVLSFGDRLANALVAYAKYLGRCFWPTNMAVLYPYEKISAGAAIAAFVLLGAITAAVVLLRRTAPYLAVGWFWFLGTLVPVIGIVQIGSQSMADRYTYFPYIGLFLAIVWGVADVARRVRIPERPFAASGVAIVALLACVAWKQTGYWKDSETLFARALAVTGPNVIAEYTLGQALQLTEPDRALTHLRKCIDLTRAALQEHPGAGSPVWYPQAHVAAGTALLMKARTAPTAAERLRLIDDATRNLNEALRIDPDAAHARPNLELASTMRAQIESVVAKVATQRNAELDARYNAFLNGGTALSQQGKIREAVEEFRKAVQLAPASPEARIYLALGLLQANELRDGAAELREAKKLDGALANDFVTKALRLAPDPGNLDRLIAQAER
jgi:tetratricopeptide (TPR) repeat protein